MGFGCRADLPMREADRDTLKLHLCYPVALGHNTEPYCQAEKTSCTNDYILRFKFCRFWRNIMYKSQSHEVCVQHLCPGAAFGVNDICLKLDLKVWRVRFLRCGWLGGSLTSDFATTGCEQKQQSGVFHCFPSLWWWTFFCLRSWKK